MRVTAAIVFSLASCPFLTFTCVKEETVIYTKLLCYMRPSSTNLSKTFYGARIMLDSKSNEFTSQCSNEVYSEVKICLSFACITSRIVLLFRVTLFRIK